MCAQTFMEVISARVDLDLSWTTTRRLAPTWTNVRVVNITALTSVWTAPEATIVRATKDMTFQTATCARMLMSVWQMNTDALTTVLMKRKGTSAPVPVGFVVGNDSKTCQDVNECLEGIHQCSHECNERARILRMHVFWWNVLGRG